MATFDNNVTNRYNNPAAEKKRKYAFVAPPAWRVAKVSSVVNEGQEIEVKILSIDPEAQKIALSHKACQAPPKPKEATANKEEEAEEPVRDLAVPER